MPPVQPSRLRTVTLATLTTVAGIGLTIRYQANALRANELEQQRPQSASSRSSPNLHVSVDRSGYRGAARGSWL